MSDNEELEDQLADQQAEEDAGAGEGEEAEGGDEGAAGLVEGEADEEDEAEYQDSSEEDEDEEQNEYEADGFIVDDAEEEEEEEEERAVAPKRKKKKKRERELRLDDEDYDLLEENQVQGFRRPTGRKRLKSKADEARKATDAAGIQKELFGYEELEDEVDDIPGGGRDGERRDGGGGGQVEEDFDDLDDEQDEMADFIVEGDGAPRRRNRRKAAAIPGVSSRAMQDAFEIFGDVDALMDMYEAARQRPGGEGQEGQEGGEGAEEEEEEEFADGDDEDEEAAEARRQRRQQRQRDKTYRQAMKVMDPEQLARAHLRPEDQAIKDRDVPERLQEALGADGGAGDVASGKIDLDAAADWIYRCLRDADTPEWDLIARGVEEIDGSFDPNASRPDQDGEPEPKGAVEGDDVLGGPEGALLRLTFHRAVLNPRSDEGIKRWKADEGRHGRVKAAIRAVLSQFLERHEEVPVVAMYRKELAGPLLAMADDDTPRTSTVDELERFNRENKRHKKHYDQGFVQPHHRKIRRWAVLWAVFDAALKYRALVLRRDRAATAAARSRDLLTAALADVDPTSERAAQMDGDIRALEECADGLQAASTLDALSDAQQRMNGVLASYPEVHMAALSISSDRGGAGGAAGGDRAAGGGATRRPNRGGANRAARHLGIQELVSDFTLTPAQFVANLGEAGQSGLAHEPPTPAGGVAEWAAAALEQLRAKHPDSPILTAYTPDQLLSLVRSAAVSTLAADGPLRSYLRAEVAKYLMVSCETTEAGEGVLDPFHKYALAARLRKKPVFKFGHSDLFLRLEEASRERLATLRVHMDSTQQEQLVTEVCDVFVSGERSQVAQQWNQLRREIVTTALTQQLLPAVTQHYRAKLLAEARDAAVRQYADGLWRIATAGPLRLPLADAEDEFLTNPRLCIVVYGNQELNPATGQPNNTAVVFLNELGNLVDFFFAGQLSGQVRRSGQGAGAVFTDPAKSRDAAKIREKLLEHLPHAVLVGLSCRECRQLHDDIRNIADSLLEHSADALQDHETRSIYCYPVEERLAALWENSAAARNELREHAPLVRRAVGLGRAALDPLSLLAALCGPDKEVLSMQVYDMQEALSKDERMAAVQRVMVTATAQVGVDVNLACNVAWRSELLQFVPGLGPRKAGALLAALTRNRNKAESRSMLYKDLGVMGKVVFRNAGPYLRVRHVPGIRHLENLSFRTLDATRISPETYRIAIQLAQAAAGVSEAEAALEERDKIECYDLERFMSDQNMAGPPSTPGLPTLIDIVAELVAPGFELRPAWAELTQRQVFLLCNNESEESLRVGRVVDVKITFVTRDALKVSIEGSGTEGVVRPEDVSSAMERSAGSGAGLRLGGPEWQDAMRGRVGTTARARILGLEEQPDATGEGRRFVVLLSTKSSKVNDEDGVYERTCKDREENYVPRERGADAGRLARVPEAQRVQEQRVQIRPIRHPMFKNISQAEAAAQLGKPEVPVGSCIIRPDARNRPNMLNVSIKTAYSAALDTPFIAVLQLQESDKPMGPAAHLSLAPPFSVDFHYCGMGVVKYEDLDQVVAELVEPMVSHCQQVTAHRKYMDAAQPQVEEKVRQEKQANPAFNPYYLSIHKANTFYIFFCLSTSVHKEPFHATPKGFYFRSRTLPSVEHVLAAFKKQPVDPSKRANAARGDQLGYSAPTSNLPNMRTGVQPPSQHQYGSGNGAAYGQQGGGYPPQQAYGGGGGQYGGPPQHAYGGGGLPGPPPGQYPGPPGRYGAGGGGGAGGGYGGQQGYGRGPHGGGYGSW